MKVVFLEEVFFAGFDPSDGERIEYRIGSGFWANRRKLSNAKKTIKKSLGEGWHLEESEYDVETGPGQKYLYVLNHEYSLSNGTCYYYSFPPQSNRKKCLSQKAELEKEPKFAYSSDRIYDTKYSGWFIERYDIVF